MTLTSFIQTTPIITKFSPGDPGGTTSTAAFVMMGLGSTISYTAKRSGVIFVSATCRGQNNTINDGFVAVIKFGTGTAPINGAAVTGTSITQNSLVLDADLAANNRNPLTFIGFTTLTNATTWFDIALEAVTGGTASLTGIDFNIVEF